MSLLVIRIFVPPLKYNYNFPPTPLYSAHNSTYNVKVLDTNDKWFGVTYKEDKDYVVKSFARLIEDGVYQKNLFEDLK